MAVGVIAAVSCASACISSALRFFFHNLQALVASFESIARCDESATGVRKAPTWLLKALIELTCVAAQARRVGRANKASIDGCHSLHPGFHLSVELTWRLRLGVLASALVRRMLMKNFLKLTCCQLSNLTRPETTLQLEIKEVALLYLSVRVRHG
jgi:hypothetical protein